MIDAGGLRFVDPFGLTMLGASFQELWVWEQRVVITGLREDLGRYLQRMDLFRDVELLECAPPPAFRHNRQDSLVELTQIHSVTDAADNGPRLANALVGRCPAADLVPDTSNWVPICRSLMST
ncbi:MAG: hypothetical protein ACI9VI_002204 [Candidatus Azotimanducaceae bacterium]